MTPQSILCAVVLLLSAVFVPAQDPARVPVKPPLAEEVASKRVELSRLLATACPLIASTNPPAPPSGGTETFSPYLTASENMRLHALLLDSQVTQALTLEQVLMAAKQRQIEGPTSFQFHNLMALLNQRWPHDPATTAFFREALSNRGAAAIKDLANPLSNAWDKSFTIPVVEFMERTGSYQNALPLLNYHHAAWAQEAAIPPRLSKVVMKAHPTLAHPLISPKPEDNRWYSVLQSLARTRDPAMVPVLRRFLKIKTIDGEGLNGAERTPRRVCDSAAVAIKTLLGYPLEPEDLSAYSGVIPGSKDYPRWKEWDQKIEALEKHLDVAPLTIPKTPSSSTVLTVVQLKVPPTISRVYWSVETNGCSIHIHWPSVREDQPSLEHPPVQVWLLKSDGTAIPQTGKSGTGAFTKAGFIMPHTIFFFPPSARAEAVSVVLRLGDEFFVEPLGRTAESAPRPSVPLSTMLKQTSSMPWTSSMALGHLGGYPYRTNFPGVVTHDQPVTILTLRPLLKVKTVSDRASGRVLKRVCDLAFTDIKRLLGDPLVLEDRAFAGGAGHYAVPEGEWLAKWKEWDQKIDEMEKRLDILGYPSGDGTLGKYYVFPVK